MKYILIIILFVAAIVTAGCVSENKNNDGALTPKPPPFASPAESGKLKLIGSFPIGVNDVNLEYDKFLFAGHGEFVMIYNLTPSSGIKDLSYNDYQYRLDVGAGTNTTDGIINQRGIVRGLVERDGILYTCSDTGITLWDIANVSTSEPTRTSKLTIGGACWNLQLDDTGNFLFASKYGIKIFNVTDKANPTYVKSFGSSYRRIALNGNYIYSAGEHSSTTGNTSFYIWDISDRVNPSLVSTTKLVTAGSLTGIWSDGEYAYFADYKNYIGIVDVKNKAAPEVVNLKAASAYNWSNGGVCPVDLKGRDNKLYVSGRYSCGQGGGLYVFDMTKRTSLIRILKPKSSSFPGIGYTESVAIGEEGRVYVAENTYGIAIYNTSGKISGTMDPSNLLYLGGNIDTITAINEDILIAGDHNNAIWTFDISNMNDIKVLDRIYGHGRFNRGLAVSPDKHYAYVPKVMYADYDNPLGDGGFYVIDISDPSNLVIANRSGGQNSASHDAELSDDGNTLFTFESTFDVTDPLHPIKKTNTFALGKYAQRSTGNYTVGMNDTYIKVRNVTDLTAPYVEWEKRSGAGDSYRGYDTDGTTLMVVKSGGGQHLISFNITDLSNITKLKTITYGTSGVNIQQVAIDPYTHMAYVSGNQGDMRSYNITDPSNFYLVDKVNAVGNNYGGFGFDPSSGRIFTGWETGIFIFQTSYGP